MFRTLTSLPLELLQHILSSPSPSPVQLSRPDDDDNLEPSTVAVLEPADLAALALTCRALRLPAQDALLHSVVHSSSAQIARFCASPLVVRNGGLVRRLRIGKDGGGNEDEGGWKAVGRVFGMCRGVRVVRVEGWMMSLASLNGLAHLEHLTLLSTPLVALPLPASFRLPSLAHLTLGAVVLSSPSSSSSSSFLSHHALPALKSLELREWVYASRPPPSSSSSASSQGTATMEEDLPLPLSSLLLSSALLPQLHTLTFPEKDDVGRVFWAEGEVSALRGRMRCAGEAGEAGEAGGWGFDARRGAVVAA
ncbi:hypothetical protein JCM8097_001160 [Rhodosporidiobolus ruineniae]